MKTISEKLDGINARWDGASLRTRDGHRIAAPDWFLAGLPKAKLTGELWAGRGRFETVLSILNSKDASSRWTELRFMVFDGPECLHFGRHAEYVEQIRWTSQAAEDQFYERVIISGGEGIMIRDSDGVCTKRKPITDDDAEVIAYQPGTGRNAARLGALLVRDRQNREFKIGNGLSDETRDTPPAIGSIITFSFQGRTKNLIPRFTSFRNVRVEKSFAQITDGSKVSRFTNDREKIMLRKSKIRSTKASKSAKAEPKVEAKHNKLCALDAAAKVLASAKEPMNCQSLIETPAQTLYAAISREISEKGKDSRFKKTDRGSFAAA